MANEPNWEDLLKPRGGPSSQQILNTLKWVQPLALFMILALWLASGVYMVSPGHTAVIRQFGKEVRQTGTGLQWHLPYPIEQRDIVHVDRVRVESIGVPQAQKQHGWRGLQNESLMLTGDENIVDAQMVVQYEIKDPTKYLFRLRNPEVTLHAAAEVALRSVAGKTTIDQILTVGRSKVQDETQEFLQQLLDDYESGLQVSEVLLQTVDPPAEVKDAFHEVVRAREDREKLMRQAEGYAEDILPKARGRAEEILRGAEAYKEERVLRATGDVSRFTQLLAEYHKAPAVTRARLQLDTMQHVLAKNQTVVMDPSAAKQVAPFLPLKGLSVPRMPATGGEQ